MMIREPSTAPGRYSLESFRRLPEEDAHRLELVRGRLVREPRPAPLHARVAIRLGRLLEEHAEAAGAGPVLADCGFVLAVDPPTVRAPDLAFVARERVPDEGYGGGFWHLAPDLAVEILSPSNPLSEVQEKVLDYTRAGARRVWLVDPRLRTVSVHEPGGAAILLEGDDVLEGEDVLPGFRVELPRIFRL